jgi:hypothetical protein
MFLHLKVKIYFHGRMTGVGDFLVCINGRYLSLQVSKPRGLISCRTVRSEITPTGSLTDLAYPRATLQIKCSKKMHLGSRIY